MTERKYPKSFEPQENQIYKITPIGGLKDDGSRWANPRVIDIKNISKKTGKPYTSHLINCIIEEINFIDGNWEEGKSAERGWFLPYDIVEKVRTLVDDYKREYPFYYRLKVGIDKETKKAKKIHKIFTTSSEIIEVQQDMVSEKDVKPIKQKPEHEFQTISKFDYDRKIIEWLKDIDRKIELCSTQELEKKFNDIAYILEFISNIDNTLNMILNTILEWRKNERTKN